MPESCPLMEMPVVDTTFPLPTVLVLNVEVAEYENTSPLTRLSLKVTEAFVVRSYTLLTPVVVTVKLRLFIVAVLLAVVFGV